MLVLGIDTATRVCAVALCDDKKIIKEYALDEGMTHSEKLVPLLDKLFKETKTAKQAIDLIAVTTGPGSFTGLRIGLATAEAMAYSLKKPLVEVNTLEALANNIAEDKVLLAPIMDAQKGNYYLALYERLDGKIAEREKVRIVPGDKLEEVLLSYNKPVIVLGEYDKIADKFSSPRIKLATGKEKMPEASSVAFIGEDNFKKTGEKSYFGLEPFYIRKSEAEELWEIKQKNNIQ